MTTVTTEFVNWVVLELRFYCMLHGRGWTGSTDASVGHYTPVVGASWYSNKGPFSD
jgi:hypothetical protein